MAFDAKGLQVGHGFGITGSSSGLDKTFREATYITDDPPSAVEAAGYFNAGVVRLAKNTIVKAIMNASASPPLLKQYIVTANTGSAVTIALLETGAGGGVSPVTVMDAAGISSKASDAAVHRWVAPFAFKINKLRSVLNAALADGDATVTLDIGGTPVTNGVLTATQAGSAAGDADEATPTAANTGAAGAVISATVGGASTATATLNLQIELEEIA